MPQLNISLSGKASASASGEITDPTVLLQIKALMRTLQDDALKAPEPQEYARTDANPQTPAAS